MFRAGFLSRARLRVLQVSGRRGVVGLSDFVFVGSGAILSDEGLKSLQRGFCRWRRIVFRCDSREVIELLS